MPWWKGGDVQRRNRARYPDSTRPMVATSKESDAPSLLSAAPSKITIDESHIQVIELSESG